MAGIVEGPFRFISAASGARRNVLRVAVPGLGGDTTVAYRRSFVRRSNGGPGFPTDFYDYMLANKPYDGENSQTLTEIFRITATVAPVSTHSEFGALLERRYFVETGGLLQGKTAYIARADGAPISHYAAHTETGPAGEFIVGFYVFVLGYEPPETLEFVGYEAVPVLPVDRTFDSVNDYLGGMIAQGLYNDAEARNAAIPPQHVRTMIGPGVKIRQETLRPVEPNVANWPLSNPVPYVLMEGESRSRFMTFGAEQSPFSGSDGSILVYFAETTWGREEDALTPAIGFNRSETSQTMTQMALPAGFSWGWGNRVLVPDQYLLVGLTDTFVGARQTAILKLSTPQGPMQVPFAFADAQPPSFPGASFGPVRSDRATYAAELRYLPPAQKLYHTIDRRLYYPYVRTA